MDKFTRQLSLVALLEQSPRALTFEEIRAHLKAAAYPQTEPESARRAFERDKKDLLEMGLPLETTAVPDDPSNSAYSIAWERSALGDPGFTPAELAALRFAATATALRSEGVEEITDASRALRKYGGMGGPPSTPSVAEVRLDANLTALFAAILDRHPVGFSYAERTRRVMPRQLAHVSGHWYLRSDDMDEAAPRTYRLDRIDGGVLRIVEDPSEVAAPDGSESALSSTLRFRPWEFGDGPQVSALVRLDGPAAAVALAEDPSIEVVDEDRDSTTVRLTVRNRDGLFAWLVSFLQRAELLEPQDLRAEYVAHLRGLAGEDVGSPA